MFQKVFSFVEIAKNVTNETKISPNSFSRLLKEKHLDLQSHLLDYQHIYMPASVAQLDARPTGDQEVAGSTPAEVGDILSWILIMKSPLPLIQEGQLSVSGERILVDRLED